jgi:hypothetical protein
VHRETGPKARLLKDYRRVYDAQPTFSNIFFMPWSFQLSFEVLIFSCMM